MTGGVGGERTQVILEDVWYRRSSLDDGRFQKRDEGNAIFFMGVENLQLR